jgi:anti-sigma B factor antagonist
LAPAPFTIAMVDDDGDVEVIVVGDVDTATSADLRRALEGAIEIAARRVVVDLQQVEYLDSSGIKVLLRANIRARVTGKAFVLRGAQGSVRRVLDLTGVDRILAVDEPGRPGEADPATT